MINTSVSSALDSKACEQLGADEQLFKDALTFAGLRFEDVKGDAPLSITGLKRGVLKHQLLGAFWCIVHGRTDCPGGCIGDDMGFGKVRPADIAPQLPYSNILRTLDCDHVPAHLL